MNHAELELLANEKDTTPEALAALINDQAYFERIFEEACPLFVIPAKMMSEPGQPAIPERD